MIDQPKYAELLAKSMQETKERLAADIIGNTFGDGGTWFPLPSYEIEVEFDDA